MVVAPLAPANIEITWGNQTVSDTLHILLAGPIHLGGGETHRDFPVLASGGSYGSALLSDNNAQAGAPFTVTTFTQNANAQLSGAIAGSLFLPMLWR